MPDRSSQSFIRRNTIAVQKGIPDSRNINVVAVPDSPRIWKPMLVSFIGDEIAVFVTQCSDSIRNRSKRNDFRTVNADSGCYAAVRLANKQIVARAHDRNCIDAFLA